MQITRNGNEVFISILKNEQGIESIFKNIKRELKAEKHKKKLDEIRDIKIPYHWQ
jgi:hypothetical protein